MDLLPVQGSAVPCERVFSSSKETMAPRRNHIGPVLMEALQILKFSFKYGRGLDFSVGTSWDDKLKELEHLALERIPEDVNWYTQGGQVPED